MLARILMQTAAWLAILGALLFVAAGDWRWPAAWVFLIELGGCSAAICVWLARHDPALLAQRATSPVRRDQPPWDRAFMALLIAAFFGWMVLMGLDARRWHSSAMPVEAQALGAVAIGACMVLVWRTFRWNTFAVPQARLQGDRGQRVVSEGPYRVVRHPMYAGAILLFLGTPLLLGSQWGLGAAPFFVAAIAARAAGEERMLRRGLEGYEAYMLRVRWRLVPGIW